MRCTYKDDSIQGFCLFSPPGIMFALIGQTSDRILFTPVLRTLENMSIMHHVLSD